MKKKLSAILAVLATVLCFGGCSVGLNSSSPIEKDSSEDASSVVESLDTTDSVASASGSLDEVSDSSEYSSDSSDESFNSSEESFDSSEESFDSSSEESFDSSEESFDSSEESFDSSEESFDSSEESFDSSSEESFDSSEDSSDSSDMDYPQYTYQSFTPVEKQDCETYLGEVLPFVANNEYYVDIIEDSGLTWVNFYTYDNTKAEFDAYRAQYSQYTFIEAYEDEYGDTWYCYEKGYLYVELSYYVSEGSRIIDVYAVYDDGSAGGDEGYLYHDFTDAEKALFTQYIGEIIPFLPNDEYYVEGYYEETDYENGMWVGFYDVTEIGFALYRGMYSDYDFVDEYEDEEGDTWYCYEKDDVYVEMVYFYYDGEFYLEVYVTSSLSEGGDVGGDADGEYLYYDFTDEEKALFTQYIGEIIPFLPNDEYYVEGYYEETDYENGMWVGFYDVTEMGFALYRGMYSDYDFVDEYEDEEGDTWYCYEKDDVYVEMVYYYTEEGYALEVYVTSSLSDGGDVGGDVGGDEDVDLITNDGKGLPTDADGVYDVDFTNATYVKDVTEQGYYLDGCPTKGNVKVLVIPVEFSDVTAASKGYSLEKINLAFNGGTGTTDYYSVSEYYNISSYGQLNLEFVVMDSWFRPAKTSSYYANATIDYYGSEVEAGDQMIMDEALAYLESKMDLSQFDADDNDFIDAVVMVNTLEINSDVTFQWAYRYWNLYTDDDGYYYEYDGVSANDYLWAPYQFLMEAYDDEGYAYYDEDVMNTYTFIHEFGHVLGADDYYDTAYVGAPMEGLDIMDSMTGDHNAYTKFNYGWLTNSRLIVAEESVTVTLDAFSENGDTIIIANNWDDALGAYQEYFIVVYYTQSGLNGGDYGYFLSEGIIVYHVNASLYKEVVETETYYDVYNNNTDASDEYGTVNNLIEYVTHEDGHYVFLAGESLSGKVKTDAGEKIAYTFTVDALTADSATLTFEKNN